MKTTTTKTKVKTIKYIKEKVNKIKVIFVFERSKMLWLLKSA